MRGVQLPLKEKKEVVVTNLERSEMVVDTSESEGDTAVIVIRYNGVEYLKADDNTVYDKDSHEEIGVWDNKTKKIKGSAAP